MTKQLRFPGDHVGLLVAAGRGRRMGQTKQLVAVGPHGRPLVAASFDALASACRRMVVVLGHELKAVQAALRPRTFHTVVGDPDAEMFDSIHRGLDYVHRQMPGSDVLLHLGDHPAVGPATWNALQQARSRGSDRILVPVHRGRGGHPVWIPATQLKMILGCHSPLGGLRAVWRQHPDRCLRVDVDDPAVVRDVDAPADLVDVPG